MKKVLLTGISLLYSVCLLAQKDTILREIVIGRDTVFDKYKSSSIYEEGTELRLIITKDSSVRNTRLFNFYLWHNGSPDGTFMLFYFSNMPKIKGSYKDGKEDGDWYYWSDAGKLTKREVWQKGKLLKTIKRR